MGDFVTLSREVGLAVAMLVFAITSLCTVIIVLWRDGNKVREERIKRAEDQVDKLLPSVEKLADNVERQNEQIRQLLTYMTLLVERTKS